MRELECGFLPICDIDGNRVEGVITDRDIVMRGVAEALDPESTPVAEIETNIRLSGTQEILVVAEMSDGSLWKARQQVRVVVGACSTLSARF